MQRFQLVLTALAIWSAAGGARSSGVARAQSAAGPNQRAPFSPGAASQEVPQLPRVAEGYCLTTLRDSMQWIAGQPQWGAIYDGREYLFSDAQRRAAFVAAPERYVPVLGGDCVVTFRETGERRGGSIRFGARHNGRLYFFAGADELARFLAEPEQYAQADVAEGGACPVSRLDENRVLPGIPETVLTYGGRRYLFANGHARTKFLQNPERYGVDGAGASRPGSAGISDQPQSDGATPAAPRRAVAGESQTEDAAPGDDAAGEGGSGVGQALMDGYCPVTIRETGAWVRGRYDYRVEFGRMTFLTAGAAEHDALANDPLGYLPALAGDCVVSFVDEGTRTPGSVFHAAEYEGRLYLLADAAHKATFKADPRRYAEVDVAAGGTCVVTQRDVGRATAGSSDFAAWYDGLIYRFAGAEERKKFLADPSHYAVELADPGASNDEQPAEEDPPAESASPPGDQSADAQ